MRRWPLRTQLVVGVCAIVTTVLVAVGVASVLTLRASVARIVDTQLVSAADAFSQSVVKYRSTPEPSGDLPGPYEMKPLAHLIGQAPGNVVVLLRDGKVVDSALFGDGDATAVPPDVLDEIVDHVEGPTESSTEWLDGLGEYRFTVRPAAPGELLVTGASLRQASAAAQRVTTVVVALTALALVVTAVGTLAMVRFALRPLARVTSTAAEVATLPLNRDQYAITPRVPAADADPRTEVGLVGDALNRLLAHVERALAEVAASDRRMRQFITDASHELRTPLAAIHGYAELTRQDSAVLPETTEYSLARIEAESARMNTLVSDLLLLARLDERQDLEMADVDLVDLVTNAVNDAAVSVPTHQWACDAPKQPVWVRGDRAKLHQAVANLLSNAGSHTPDGTTVTTRITADSTSASVAVTDDGPGIASELVPHLFERFVRADKARSRQAGHSGLGLAIAASIVEAHGGTIDVESRPGATTFRISVPLATAAVEPATETTKVATASK